MDNDVFEKMEERIKREGWNECLAIHGNKNQADGPHRPTGQMLATVLDSLPPQMEVRRVSINGQTGIIAIEYYYEGIEQLYTYNLKPI